MRRVLWVTDPHLDFLPPFGARAFGRALGNENPKAEGLILTGDVGRYDNLRWALTELAEGFNRPVWFVLGNHDAYGGSIREAETVAREVTLRSEGRISWLPVVEPIELAPDTMLVGVDGWWDASAGDPYSSRFLMNDWVQIGEFQGFMLPRIIEVAQGIGAAMAKRTTKVLQAALARKPRTVIYACHVPPFPGASWHEGGISGNDTLPWYSNLQAGKALLRIGEANPDVNFLVLCGHTHSPGRYSALPNMLVLTGRSDYGNPQISAILDPGAITLGA